MSKSEKVSLVPDWKAAAQIYIMALEDGTWKGKQAARQGILEMADTLDRLIAEQKEQEK